VLHSTGVLDELETIVESGVLGGVASPGAFFGTSINPQRIVSSAQAFHRIYDHLDAIIVGALQVVCIVLLAGVCTPHDTCVIVVGGLQGQCQREQERRRTQELCRSWWFH